MNLAVVTGDIARCARGAKKDEDEDVGKELGNLVLSAFRWMDDLGFDPAACVEKALWAQRDYIDEEQGRNVYRHKVTGMRVKVIEFRLGRKPYPWYVCLCNNKFGGRPHYHESAGADRGFLVEEGDFMRENPPGVLKRSEFLERYERV